MFPSLMFPIHALGLCVSALCLSASVLALYLFTGNLKRSLESAPSLSLAPPIPRATPPSIKLAVVIPAYNEEINIRECLEALLQSELDDSQQMEVWVADDRSTDSTVAIAESVAARDPRVHVLTVPTRPRDAIWRGKNWACTQASLLAAGDYLLFIDADVRLAPQSLRVALAEATSRQTDLLSCAPSIVCNCFSEWLVQPIMMAILAVGFDFQRVNDPQSATAFAAGPFMLFRRAAYDAVGGHRAVADDLVEDVALAKRIKVNGLRLHYVLALGLIDVNMYRSLAGLWEGWTKNFYLGAGRNLRQTLYCTLVIALVYVMPWLGLLFVSSQLASNHLSFLTTLVGLLTFTALAMHYHLRLWSAQRFGLPLRYSWLGWLGGIMVISIAIASIIKTETGWGWTWRGRSLAVTNNVAASSDT